MTSARGSIYCGFMSKAQDGTKGITPSDKPGVCSRAARRKLIYIVGRKAGHEHLGGVRSRRVRTYNLPVSIHLPPNCALKLLSIPKLEIHNLPS